MGCSSSAATRWSGAAGTRPFEPGQWSQLTVRFPDGGELPTARFGKRVRDEFVFGGLRASRVPGPGAALQPGPRPGARSGAASLTMRNRARRCARSDVPGTPSGSSTTTAALSAPLPAGQRFAAGSDLRPLVHWHRGSARTGDRLRQHPRPRVVPPLRRRCDAQGKAKPGRSRRARRTGIRHALAVGVSQSGRYLRHFLELGMNRDTKRPPRLRRRDALRRRSRASSSATSRSGSPGRTAGQHAMRDYPENWFPFSYASSRRIRSPGGPGALAGGRRVHPPHHRGKQLDGVLAQGRLPRCTPIPPARATCPSPKHVRLFLVAGTEHAGSLGSALANETRARTRATPIDPSPALRALLVALDEWVSQRPGAAREPRSDPGRGNPGGTRAAGLSRHPRLRGPRPGESGSGPPVDWVDPPVEDGPVYGARVPAVDSRRQRGGG